MKRKLSKLIEWENALKLTAFRTWWLEISVNASIYLVLTLIATYPMIRFIRTFPLGSGDSGQNSWNLWWISQSILRGHTPFYTNMLYYPDGVSLAYHALSPLNGILVFPILTTFKLTLPTAFNFVVLFSFVLSGVSMYILMYFLFRSRTIAFVAGIIFVFSPFRMSRVVFGNIEMYSTEFIPLVVFSLLKLRQTYQWQYAVLLAVTFALTIWSSLELGLGLGILVGLILIFDLFRVERKRELWKRWIFAGGLSVFLILPIVFPMIRDHANFQAENDQRWAATFNSADALGFFVPDSQTNPWIKRNVPSFVSQKITQLYASFYGNPYEKTVFIGYTVLLLVAMSVWLVQNWEMSRWLIIAGVFGVLSLGPVLHIAGHVVSGILPYEMFLHIPLLKVGRTPSRLALYMIFALAIVAGYGLTVIEKRWRWGKVLTILAGVIIFVEFMVAPIRMDQRFINIPSFYHKLAKQGGTGAILDVPIDLYGAQGPAELYMIYQTVHHHPIVGGYISRIPSKALNLFEKPFFNELRVRIYGDQKPYDFSSITRREAINSMQGLNVQYVVLHKNILFPDDVVIVRTVLENILLEPQYEDDTLTVWQNNLKE